MSNNTMSPLLWVLLTVTGAAGAEQSCPGAPSMMVESACRKASHTQATYDMCRDALRDIPNPMSDHDATVYALATARRALASADATMDAAIKLITYNHSLSGDERDAYSECVEAYTMAEHAMVSVINRFAACGFDGGGLAGDYMDGLLDVESCRDRVLKLTASPIYAMVLVNRNKVGLALFLGKLLGI